MSEIKMKMVGVVSSNIKEVGYDETRSVLRVTFHKGGSYEYEDVLPKEYEALLNAESIGSHFYKNIRNVFAWKKLS